MSEFMYCPVVLMSPSFSFEIKRKHRSKELLCVQQCFTQIDRCKLTANGYEQGFRQIWVHEDLFLSSVPQIRFPQCHQKFDLSRC